MLDCGQPIPRVNSPFLSPIGLYGSSRALKIHAPIESSRRAFFLPAQVRSHCGPGLFCGLLSGTSAAAAGQVLRALHPVQRLHHDIAHHAEGGAGVCESLGCHVLILESGKTGL